MIEKIQIKYDGRFHEILMNELDVDAMHATDNEVRSAVAVKLGASSLSEYVVQPAENHPDRSEVTVLNLRPEATFGGTHG